MQNNENEESIALLKRKHQENISELSAHIDTLSKSKLKFVYSIQFYHYRFIYYINIFYKRYEKDYKSFLRQHEDLRKDYDNLARAKVNIYILKYKIS